MKYSYFINNVLKYYKKHGLHSFVFLMKFSAMVNFST